MSQLLLLLIFLKKKLLKLCKNFFINRSDATDSDEGYLSRGVPFSCSSYQLKETDVLHIYLEECLLTALMKAELRRVLTRNKYIFHTQPNTFFTNV